MPGALVFRMTDGPVDTHRLPQLVGLDPRRLLAAPGGTRQRHRGAQGPSRGAGRLRGRRRLRRLGRQGAADARRSGNIAARGGLEGAEFAWGGELTPGGQASREHLAGPVPLAQLRADGFAGTCPVRSFPPNGLGLFEVCGNVWEWTTDWFVASHAAPDAGKPGCCAATDPRGPAMEASFDPRQPQVRIPRRVVKGGSFLCAPSYCRRYRPAARHAQMVDSGMSHIGFRCIRRETP